MAYTTLRQVENQLEKADFEDFPLIAGADLA
jgi:hypothetical protein